jgi:ADP-heptose:LPS heptosyltransferase
LYRPLVMLRLRRLKGIVENNGNPLDVSKILFITHSNICDVILTTPKLEALHQQFPDAVIDIVCDQLSAIIFQYYPYLSKLIHKEKKAGWNALNLQVIANTTT